jgi:hypothetical protein
MDSIASPKVKTTEGERIGVRFLVHSISRIERHVGALGGIKKIDKQFNHSHGPAQIKQQVG